MRKRLRILSLMQRQSRLRRRSLMRLQNRLRKQNLMRRQSRLRIQDLLRKRKPTRRPMRKKRVMRRMKISPRLCSPIMFRTQSKRYARIWPA